MSINRKNADGTYTEVAGVPYVTKENIGLSKVENKSSEEIRGEITSKNINDALGYTPANDVDEKKSQNDIAVLSSRMDGFTNLPEGSTAGDAELADIRVGADGKTYSNAGTAVRSQVTEIKENVVYISDGLGAYTMDGYITSAGTYANGPGRICTSFIPCNENTAVTYMGETNHAGVFGVSFWDKDKKFISGIANNGAINTEYTVTSPSGTCFVRVSSKPNYKTSIKLDVMKDLIASKADINSKINDLNKLSTVENYLVHGYISNEGAFYAAPDRVCTAFVPCKPNAAVDYAGETNHAGISGISFYDSDKKFISGIANNGPSNNIYSVTSPANTAYLRVSSKPAYQTYVYTDGMLNNTLLELLSETQQASSASGGSDKIVYVSPDGNDSNDGSTPEKAVKTFNKAFKLGNVVKAKRGVYHESFYVSNGNNLKIMPSDLSETYSHDKPYREKIQILGGIEIKKTDLTTQNGLYTASVSGGFNFTEVFINKTTAPVTSGKYAANVFVVANASDKIKLKPVLTLAECSEANTFFWNGTTIYCNISISNFEKIAIVDEGYGVGIYSASGIEMTDVVIKYAYGAILNVANSKNVHLVGCEASYSAMDMGFKLTNSDGTLDGCYATHNLYDGFNYHGYGNTIMNDCVSEYNWDDGCSHHDGCTGTINGGRFTGNGKCGIAPAYGADINIYNAVCNSNPIGIGYLSTDNGHKAMKGVMSSCVMYDNTTGLKVDPLCSVTAINCKYSTNTTDKETTGTLVEFN